MLVDECVYFGLVVVFYLHFGCCEETQPYFADMPHKLILWSLVVLDFFRVIPILSILPMVLILLLIDMSTNGPSESPLSFLPDDILKFQLTRHDHVQS